MQKPLLALALLMTASLPAAAGTITYSNGTAQWRATGCTQPQGLAYNAGPADQLSSNVTAYNNYSRSVESYLACLTQEANADMQSSNNAVAAELARVNQAWQQDLAMKKQQMTAMRHP